MDCTNDNELLYYIHECDEYALKVLINKYIPLIKSRMNRYNIKGMDRDDFMQEGMMILLRSIKMYDMNSPKTFNKYFDLLLTRKFKMSLKKEYNYRKYVVLVDDYLKLEQKFYKDVKPLYEIPEDMEIDMSIFSKTERKVFMYVLNDYKPAYISEIMQVDTKKIYNVLYRIKAKLKA